VSDHQARSAGPSAVLLPVTPATELESYLAYRFLFVWSTDSIILLVVVLNCIIVKIRKRNLNEVFRFAFNRWAAKCYSRPDVLHILYNAEFKYVACSITHNNHLVSQSLSSSS
jgi:hypothetical protein